MVKSLKSNVFLMHNSYNSGIPCSVFISYIWPTTVQINKQRCVIEEQRKSRFAVVRRKWFYVKHIIRVLGLKTSDRCFYVFAKARNGSLVAGFRTITTAKVLLR